MKLHKALAYLSIGWCLSFLCTFHYGLTLTAGLSIPIVVLLVVCGIIALQE